MPDDVTNTAADSEPAATTAPTDLDALRLFVRYDEGEGPAIVYLHGINSDAQDWRKVIDHIGPGYRHIAPDILGFGESPKPLDIEYTADEHTLVLDNTLRDLGVDQHFLLVGYSLGGDIAIRYASTWPQKLRRLFLLSTPFYLPPECYDPSGFGTKFLMQMGMQWAWRFVGGAKKHNDLLYKLADGRFEDAAKGFLRTDDVPKHWDIMSKNLQNCIAAATFVDDLPRLTMPVTFALGVRDVIVQPDQTPALKRLKPDMEIRRIVGLNADHFMLVALPERVAQEIMRDEIRELAVPLRMGSGAPVVLLHGLNSVGKDWKPVAEALSVSQEAVAIDLLGFGDSPHSETLLYTLEDHAIGVINTMRKLFGDTPVTLVGQNLGSSVALQVAADRPDLVERVVAFSPVLLPPGFDPTSDHVQSEAAAALLAAREALLELGDSNAQRVASDKLVRKALPLGRSLQHSVLDVNGGELLDRQQRPVTFVVPSTNAVSAGRFLKDAVEQRPDRFVLEEPTGPQDMVFAEPSRAVELIEPDNAAAIAKATTLKPAKQRHGVSLADAARSVENQLLVRGVVELLLGIAVLSLRTLPRNLLELGFAIWVMWEGVYSIVGSLGLRREKKGWLPYFLIGALVLVVGAFLLANQDLNLVIIGLLIAARSIYVGIANIIVARNTGPRGTPKPVWLVYIQGALGIAVGLSLVFVPQVGARLLKWVVGGYLVGSGVLVMGQAWSAKRVSRREFKRLLASVEDEAPVADRAA